jgi:hypothetical protein
VRFAHWQHARRRTPGRFFTQSGPAASRPASSEFLLRMTREEIGSYLGLKLKRSAGLFQNLSKTRLKSSTPLDTEAPADRQQQPQTLLETKTAGWRLVDSVSRSSKTAASWKKLWVQALAQATTFRTDAAME